MFVLAEWFTLVCAMRTSVRGVTLKLFSGPAISTNNDKTLYWYTVLYSIDYGMPVFYFLNLIKGVQIRNTVMPKPDIGILCYTPYH